MDVIALVINFLVSEVLSKPAYLLGLVVAVGLIALRKSAGEVIGGTLKATLGFLILGVGAGAVIAALAPFGTMVLKVFGAQGVVPTNEAIVAIAQKDYGTTVAAVMAVGILVNLLLARFTPLKYIFLTGHHIFYMATMLAVILTTQKLGNAEIVITGGILLGVIMVVMPALAQPWMRRVTGDQPIAMGHFGSLGYIAAAITGKYLGRKSKSTEELQVPKSLGFLRDPMLATAAAMIVIYEVFAILYRLAATDADVDKLTGGTNFAAFVFGQGLAFAVGVAVILLGVRTIIGEVVPAFAGIAARVVPDAMPALDCPVAFPYAPNAVIIGFLASLVGGLVSLGVLGITGGLALGLALILPGMVPHFFTGGAAGVFGNATGGRVGAVLGGFVNGVLITFLPAFLMQVLGTLGFANTTFGDADFGWYGIVVGQSIRIGSPALYVALAVVVVVALGFASWVQRRYVARPTYAKAAATA
jgi:PTS system ascorbate-specific IIC component